MTFEKETCIANFQKLERLFHGGGEGGLNKVDFKIWIKRTDEEEETIISASQDLSYSKIIS